MAYGDDTPHNPQVLWSEFETMEYLFRFEDLIDEFGRTFSTAHRHPEDSCADEADKDWRRCLEELEETAIEYVTYRDRLRSEAAYRMAIERV